MRCRSTLLLCLVATTAGCYRATVVTGATPSSDTVSVPWASSWIYGLVPPKTVETAAKCPHGVAKVETHLPFVNMLVGALTLGIYTPMSIEATCASKASASAAVPDEFDVTLSVQGDEARAAFAMAARIAEEYGEPVYVKVTD